MTEAKATGAKQQGRVWRWIRRATLGLVALLTLAVLVFEFWRQHEISSAEEKLQGARVALDGRLKASPTFDQWLEGVAPGSNGQTAFIEDFLAKCAEYGGGNEPSPVSGINWHAWTKPYEASKVASAEDLKAWLHATAPIAESLAKLQSFDRITIDPRHPVFKGMLSGKSVTVMLLYSLSQLQVPAQRIVALRQLGEIEQARKEFLALLRVSRMLRPTASWAQLVYLSSFDDDVRELAWRFAADDLLKPEDFALLREQIDYKRELAKCCEGTLLWIRDEGPGAMLATDAERGNDADWFCWLNPFNYNKFSGDELGRLTILYQYEVATFADWLEYSHAWVDAARSGTTAPTAPELHGLIASPLRWNERLDALTPPAAIAEWRAIVMDIRNAALAGQGAAKATERGAKAKHLDVEVRDDSVTLRLRHTRETWDALQTSAHDSSLPTETEFYAEYPPVTLKLK